MGGKYESRTVISSITQCTVNYTLFHDPKTINNLIENILKVLETLSTLTKRGNRTKCN